MANISMTPKKAKQILALGEAHGKPLTEKQRKMFSEIAKRELPRGNPRKIK